MPLKNLEDVTYYPPMEKMANILMNKVQNKDPLFFMILMTYYLAKIASMMRCNVTTLDRGEIPVSMYAINLALSGHGKGHSTNIVEEQVINEFKSRFLESTFPAIADINLAKLATKRATINGMDPDLVLEQVNLEFERAGVLPFSFDSGTTAAVKQVRHKMLMSGAGSMNMEIDEIGDNLLNNADVLSAFLELFDVGKIKQKLTKNTRENIRDEDIDGRTPANMMLFGTPVKLLDGGKTEDEFQTMLNTGFARRCFFGYSKDNTNKLEDLSPQEVMDMLTDTSQDTFIKQFSHTLGKLADRIHFAKTLTMSADVNLLFIEYQINCRKRAKSFPDHQEVLKTEMEHRYYKALKIAGAYAFADQAIEVKEEHFYYAYKLTEDSGNAFYAIHHRELAHVRLAKYIASMRRDLTQADILEDMPLYKGSEYAKRDMMNMAIAWGNQNNIIIKRRFVDEIEFFRGESLEKTNLNRLLVAHSTDITENYVNQEITWDNLYKLCQASNYNWINHHLHTPHRSSENITPGFNMVVIDVDEGISIEAAKYLLEDYKFLIYTTKRSTDKKERFRLIFPLTHIVKLTASDFKEFMQNVFAWLPFSVDTATCDIARKWASYNTTYTYHNTGELLDALLFIPKTKKAEIRKQIINSQSALNNMERWFITTTESGNRSNQMVKYALMLVDSGRSIEDIKDKLLSVNNRLEDGLEETEILSTIMITVSKKIAARDNI